MTSVTLTVRGTPAPKGSRTLGKRRDGSTFTRPASNAEHRWVEAVALEAMAARTRAGAIEPPYAVVLDFAMRRPARPAHDWPTRADLDKLIRAVLDGLTRGGLIEDDRHVVRVDAAKWWAGEPGGEGVVVTVSRASTIRPAGLPVDGNDPPPGWSADDERDRIRDVEHERSSEGYGADSPDPYEAGMERYR
ncbi:MAG: RusA family crossover junction endodeoxyribonuclease [Actinomycetota bacterium]